MSGPWEFDTAVQNAHAGAANQYATEQAVKQAYKDFAVAEETYRIALADKIVRLRADGIAATLAADLARGDKRVAELRRKRDIAEGVKEAASQASWRRSADRRDVERFAEWSMRRELAEAR